MFISQSDNRKEAIIDHQAILHALLVSYEVKMSILLCGIQPDKYVKME